jgi:hypothetical protein
MVDEYKSIGLEITMSEGILWLNGQLESCSPVEASLRLSFSADSLQLAVRYQGESFCPVNPYALGSALDPRQITKQEPVAVQAFLDALPEDSSSARAIAAFVSYEKHTARMRTYVADEHSVALSETAALTIAKLFIGLYPVFSHFLLPRATDMLYDGFYGMASGVEKYLPYHSIGDYRTFVATVWGAARKDTLRLTSSLQDVHLALIYSFHRVLPAAVLAPLVEELLPAAGYPSYFTTQPQAYDALLRVTPHQRKELFQELFCTKRTTDGAHYPEEFVDDTLSMLLLVPEEKLSRLKGATTWQELHHRAMKEASAPLEEGSLKLPAAVKNLAHASLLSYKVEPLTSGAAFLAAGAELSICLGQAGYYQKALNGESYCLLGSLQTGELAWALEVEFHHPAWYVRQLRGRDNVRLADEEALITLISTTMNGVSAHADHSL